MSTVGLGIALGLAGSIAINTGNNLQSLGMYKAQISATKSKLFHMDPKRDLKLWSSKTWVCGTVIFILGALLNFSSYGFAPQSTLASLESIQFVSNLFFGKLLLKKEITKRMYLGTFLTVGGTVLSVSFSSKKAELVEVMDDLVELWKNLLWIGYLIFIFGFAICLHISWIIWKDQDGTQNAMAVVYAVFSALWGTLSVVFAKLLAQLVEFRANDVEIFSHWFTYVTLLSWLLLMSYWLYRLNSALGLYDPLFIIPLLQANFIFFAIVSGGIYFKEFNYMKPGQWVGFVCGVACMFLGIALLVPPKDTQTRSETAEMAMESSTLKTFLTTFIIGAGCMNQREFDVKTRKEIYELWLAEAEKVDNLSESESRLADLLRVYVGGADKTLIKEKELKDLMNSKKLNDGERDRVKNLMMQVKNFQYKLGEANTEINRQSENIILNKAITPNWNRMSNRWSFRSEVSLGSLFPANLSEMMDESGDSVSRSRTLGCSKRVAFNTLEDISEISETKADGFNTSYMKQPRRVKHGVRRKF